MSRARPAGGVAWRIGDVLHQPRNVDIGDVEHPRAGAAGSLGRIECLVSRLDHSFGCGCFRRDRIACRRERLPVARRGVGAQSRACADAGRVIGGERLREPAKVAVFRARNPLHRVLAGDLLDRAGAQDGARRERGGVPVRRIAAVRSTFFDSRSTRRGNAGRPDSKTAPAG